MDARDKRGHDEVKVRLLEELFSLKRRRNVLWLSARRNENGIEAHVASGIIRMLRKPARSGRCNASLLFFADGISRHIKPRPRLHLDEDQKLATPGDNIDLAGRTAPAARDNLKAVRR